MAIPPFSAQYRDRQSVSVQGALKNAVQISGANASQNLVIASDAEARVTLRKLLIFASAAGSATVTVSDGTTVLNLGTVALTTEAKIIGLELTAPLGASITVAVGAAGIGITTTVSVIADLL